MADTTTPKLGLIKPDVGASDDSWGQKLNDNFDILDAVGVGDGVKGDIRVTDNGNTWNIMPDTVSSDELTNTGVAPGVYTNANITVDGTGRITAATSGASNAAVVFIGTMPPVAPADNTLWWESDTGRLFVYYNDGTSRQWVIIDTAGATDGPVRFDVPQVLTDSQKAQARSNMGAAPLDALAYSGMQINGSTAMNQAGTTPVIGNGHICDGWTATIGVAPGVASSGSNANTGPQIFPGGYTNYGYVVTGTAKPVLAATDVATVGQGIEGHRVARLGWGTPQAQPITIGFWSASSTPGQYGGSVRNGDATRSYVFTYSQLVSNTPEWHTITIPGDVAGSWAKDHTTGITIAFTHASGSTFATAVGDVWQDGNFIARPSFLNGMSAASNAIRITGFVVVPGSNAPAAAQSALIMRPAEQELVMCQRYLQRLSGITSSIYGSGVLFNTTTAIFGVPLLCTMRVSPSVTNSAAANFAVVQGGSLLTVSAVLVDQVSPHMGSLQCTVAGGTAGHGAVMRAANTSSWLQFDARFS